MKSPIVRVLLSILGTVLVIVLAVLGYIAMQPNDYHVERSRVMAATPEAIFAEVNDFHRWEAWSPWAKLDPNSKAIYEGPDAGEGAIFRWAGNDKVGEGSLTILESKPHEKVTYRLEFIKPMADTCQTQFILTPEGDKTKVTWNMSGTQPNFVGKVICFFMNMDKMIGADYEKGLTSIQEIVEKKPAAK
jgi:hypothetical protein